MESENAINPTASRGQKLAVSIREAAAMLSISPRSIQNFLRERRLPARKIGRRTVIPLRALEAFLRTDQPSPVVETARADSGD
jgi:excisionase family DNA binding protein